LSGKHVDVLERITENVVYFNAYVRDPNKVTVEKKEARQQHHHHHQQGGNGYQNYHGNTGGHYAKRPRHSYPGAGAGRDMYVFILLLIPRPTDPRGVRSYVDLDAPPQGTVEISYD
jgi:hypothetical protein